MTFRIDRKVLQAAVTKWTSNILYLYNRAHINPKEMSWYNRLDQHYGMKTTEMKVRIKKQV